jgi:hypothetical protein
MPTSRPRPIGIRFAPESGQTGDIAECPQCAESGLMQCSKTYQSITSFIWVITQPTPPDAQTPFIG